MSNAEHIYIYTDQDAVNDGVLVRLTGNGRVTSAVWHFIETHLPKNVPLRWPMATEDEAKYPYLPTSEAKVLALCCGIVKRYGSKAREVYDNGDMWHAAIDHTNDTILGLRPGAQGMLTVWLMPNECGGITLMLPEDL